MSVVEASNNGGVWLCVFPLLPIRLSQHAFCLKSISGESMTVFMYTTLVHYPNPHALHTFRY